MGCTSRTPFPNRESIKEGSSNYSQIFCVSSSTTTWTLRGQTSPSPDPTLLPPGETTYFSLKLNARLWLAFDRLFLAAISRYALNHCRARQGRQGLLWPFCSLVVCKSPPNTNSLLPGFPPCQVNQPRLSHHLFFRKLLSWPSGSPSSFLLNGPQENPQAQPASPSPSPLPPTLLPLQRSVHYGVGSGRVQGLQREGGRRRRIGGGGCCETGGAGGGWRRRRERAASGNISGAGGRCGGGR